MRSTLFFCILLMVLPVFGQNTVGLLSYNKEKSFDGFNLIYPHNQGDVYLLNNCGEVVHMWEDGFEYHPGITAYLLPNGNLIRAKRLKNISQDTIMGGGAGAMIEIVDWDNNLLWSYELNNSRLRLHHDIAPMPNGNILLLAWEPKNRQELVQAGRDTVKYSENTLLSEVVLEINPATNEIVWEWRLWDHLIQDFDPTKDNYGIISDHAGRLDLNYNSITSGVTWIHANSIFYNPFLDQIMISTPTYEEIWVIDHSTTTSQAATSSGGLSGVGGDFMYRWGNPRTYRKELSTDDQLSFFQHDAHWILDGISPSDPNFGKMAIFNNRIGADFSAANIISPPWDMYEWKYTKTDGLWGPVFYDEIFTHPERTAMFSTGLSSFQLLPNRNVLIHSGRQGYAFELTPQREIVWEYKVPLRNGLPVMQGATLQLNDNLSFRMTRYSADYTAFAGRDLSRKSWIELNPNEDYCESLVSTKEHIIDVPDSSLRIYPNPASSIVRVIVQEKGIFYLVDQMGRIIKNFELKTGENELEISSLDSGLYYLISGSGDVAKAFYVKE